MIWIVGIRVEIRYQESVVCVYIKVRGHLQKLYPIIMLPDQDGYPSRRGQENQKRFGNCLFQQAPVQCSALCWAIRRSILWSWYKLSALELKSISWGQSANFFTTIIPFRLVNGSPAPVISRSVIICLLLHYIPLAASFTLKKIDALMECKVYLYLSSLTWTHKYGGL